MGRGGAFGRAAKNIADRLLIKPPPPATLTAAEVRAQLIDAYLTDGPDVPPGVGPDTTLSSQQLMRVLDIVDLDRKRSLRGAVAAVRGATALNIPPSAVMRDPARYTRLDVLLEEALNDEAVGMSALALLEGIDLRGRRVYFSYLACQIPCARLSELARLYWSGGTIGYAVRGSIGWSVSGSRSSSGVLVPEVWIDRSRLRPAPSSPPAQISQWSLDDVRSVRAWLEETDTARVRIAKRLIGRRFLDREARTLIAALPATAPEAVRFRAADLVGAIPFLRFVTGEPAIPDDLYVADLPFCQRGGRRVAVEGALVSGSRGVHTEVQRTVGEYRAAWAAGLRPYRWSYGGPVDENGPRATLDVRYLGGLQTSPVPNCEVLLPLCPLAQLVAAHLARSGQTP